MFHLKVIVSSSDWSLPPWNLIDVMSSNWSIASNDQSHIVKQTYATYHHDCTLVLQNQNSVCAMEVMVI
jgi:hypothetical protein